MNVFDKKFQEMLQRSDEHKTLVKRIVALETQVVFLTKMLQDAMKAYTAVAKIAIDNQKSLEAVHDYFTDPLSGVEEDDPSSGMTPDELAEYKRNLN